MTKRAMRVSFLGISLIALVGNQAVAHYQGYIGGVHYSSVDCTQGIKGVGNPDVKPAVAECVLTGLQLEAVCINPAGHEVSGSAAFGGALLNQAQITSGDLMGQGKAMTNIHVDTDTICTSAVVCVNPNWSVQACIVRSMTVEHNVYSCTGPAGDECSVLQLNSIIEQGCQLPAAFSPQNLPPLGTDYLCNTTNIEHVR